jgi:hypothetical protein
MGLSFSSAYAKTVSGAWRDMFHQSVCCIAGLSCTGIEIVATWGAGSNSSRAVCS